MILGLKSTGCANEKQDCRYVWSVADNKEISDNVPSEIPAGLALGPALFAIYMTDLNSVNSVLAGKNMHRI